MNTSALAQAPTKAEADGSYNTHGTVIWFNPIKGYGFITCETTGNKVFCYHANIDMEGFRILDGGDKVEFRVVNTQKGLSAFNVKRI